MKHNRLSEADIRANFTSSARSVFRTLFQEGPATRPQLGSTLGLSRPTLSSSIAELDAAGYVEKIGEVQGALGRKAAMYRLGPGTGHVIAIDAGSTHVRTRVATLDRRLLHHRIYRLSSNQRHLNAEISRAVAEEVEATLALAEPGWGKLRALGVALPSRVVSDNADNAAEAATGQENLFTHFTPPGGVPLLLENNVNCAALAEQSHGTARGLQDFAYIQIGVKIGMGVVLGGRLIRGRNGAAGEIGHLPFPWGPGLRPQAVGLEDYVGAEALMQRVRAAWPQDGGTAPADTAALFAMASQGNAAALVQVERHAEDIGAIVSACVGVIDPGIVVLGGGIGDNAIMLPYVRETVGKLSYPTEIYASSLGADATVLGIEKIAADHACELLVGT